MKLLYSTLWVVEEIFKDKCWPVYGTSTNNSFYMGPFRTRHDARLRARMLKRVHPLAKFRAVRYIRESK